MTYVKVTVRIPLTHGRSTVDTYFGNVLKDPPWVNSDKSLTISTDRLDFPFRVIPIEWLITVNDQEVKSLTPRTTKERSWSVKGSKHNYYTVTKSVNDSWSCTCQGFEFKRKCRHIDELKAK